jgi:Plasmid pRiA4b ORF-3-like protein
LLRIVCSLGAGVSGVKANWITSSAHIGNVRVDFAIQGLAYGRQPMVWRRVHVPATFTLRQFHGVIQVAMGWEGVHLFQFHLRAVRHGSWEISARSAETTLESLRLRKEARFAYEYDLNVPWRHEIRLEDRSEPVPERAHPYCVDGPRGLSAGGLRRPL